MVLSTLLGDITLDAALERDTTHVSSKKYTYTFDARSHRVTTLEAGGDVTLDAGGSLGLRGARLAGEAVALRARTGGIALQAVTDSVFEQTVKTKSGPVFTASSDSGRYDETVRMVEIAARGPLTVESALGVAAEVVDAGGSLEASLDVLAERPGLEWIGPLRARDDIAWSAIAEAHRAWDYRSQGLTPAAAMVISLAVAAAIPAGAGAGLLGIEGAIGGAMADAALTSLASQAAVALAGNRGDLGATFRQLASAATLRGLTVAVASAGLTSAATDALRLPTGSDLSFSDRLRTAAVQASARTAVDATIGGRDLDEALRANLLSAATTTIGAELAGESGDIDTVAQLAAHAALGCGMGAATGGDDGCASGAGGAVVGELFAMAYAETSVMTMLKKTTAAIAAATLGMAALSIGAAAQQGQDAGVQKQNQQRIFNEEAQGTGTELYVSPANVRLIQQKLNEAGYSVGNVDGQWGEVTQNAVRNWQQAQGLEPTGNLNMVTLQSLGITQGGQQQQAQTPGMRSRAASSRASKPKKRRAVGAAPQRPIYDIDTDDAIPWEPWLEGFWQAVKLRPAAWSNFMRAHENDADVQRAMFILGRLAELSQPGAGPKPMEMDADLETMAPDILPHQVEVLDHARLARRDGAEAPAPARSAKVKPVHMEGEFPVASRKQGELIMKRTRFTEEQIIAILKEAEAGEMPANAVCRKHGISEQTFYRWKAKFGGMEVSDAKRLKAMEDENRRLKTLVADLTLDNSALKELLTKKF
jgi:peptidoglycan hydrolase-like protein with peptidoglycan-binding domain/transposase-like protein